MKRPSLQKMWLNLAQIFWKGLTSGVYVIKQPPAIDVLVKLSGVFVLAKLFQRRYDTQDNDTQHNDIHHNDTQNNI